MMTRLPGMKIMEVLEGLQENDTLDEASKVFVADLDGDGDLDIVSSSRGDDTIAWYENDGADDPTFTAADIATSADGAQDVHVADLDGDGDLDIVSAGHDDDTITWYGNDCSMVFTDR